MEEPEILGTGTQAFVVSYGSADVIKSRLILVGGRPRLAIEPPDFSRKSFVQERKVYEQLGAHPSIIQYKGYLDIGLLDFGLILEKAGKGCLRQLISSLGREAITDHARWLWAVAIASAVHHVHTKGFLHCDISTRNILVTDGWEVKLSDFGSSAALGQVGLGSEEGRCRVPSRGRSPNTLPSVKSDLFALGTVLYEIMAWEKPFVHEGTSTVEARYERDEFPDLSGILYGDTIDKCWHEWFDSGEEVVRYLGEAHQVHFRRAAIPRWLKWLLGLVCTLLSTLIISRWT